MFETKWRHSQRQSQSARFSRGQVVSQPANERAAFCTNEPLVNSSISKTHLFFCLSLSLSPLQSGKHQTDQPSERTLLEQQFLKFVSSIWLQVEMSVLFDAIMSKFASVFWKRQCARSAEGDFRQRWEWGWLGYVIYAWHEPAACLPLRKYYKHLDC